MIQCIYHNLKDSALCLQALHSSGVIIEFSKVIALFDQASCYRVVENMIRSVDTISHKPVAT